MPITYMDAISVPVLDYLCLPGANSCQLLIGLAACLKLVNRLGFCQAVPVWLLGNIIQNWHTAKQPPVEMMCTL